MFTDVLAVTPHIIDYLLPFAHISRRRSSCSVPAQLLQRYGLHFFTALALIAENRDFSYIDNDILSQEAAIFASAQ